MSKSIAVEKVETGDSIVAWLTGEAEPEILVVDKIIEGHSIRTLYGQRNDGPFAISVQLGHTVDMAC